MNRTFRASLAVLFVGVIGFSAISICQNLMRSWRVDITDQKLYTLSDGARQIVGGLNQPIRMKLYYTKTATLKANDQIRFFNNYYYYVRALLDEFVKAGKGMVQLEVIDPRPYSDDELEAIRFNLKRFAISEDENFFLRAGRPDSVWRDESHRFLFAGSAKFRRIRHCLSDRHGDHAGQEKDWDPQFLAHNG